MQSSSGPLYRGRDPRKISEHQLQLLDSERLVPYLHSDPELGAPPLQGQSALLRSNFCLAGGCARA